MTIERSKACAGRKRPGVSLKLWLTDATHAHLETIKTLAAELLDAEPSHSVCIRLAVRAFADHLHRLAVEAEAQRQKHGTTIPSPEAALLKFALAEARGVAAR